MSKKLICAIVSAATGFVAVAQPSVWYVDDDNYGKGGTGSAANPFGTIQEAVKAASTTEMDTIVVAAGVYSQGETLVSGSRYNRVNIDRKVKIVGAGQDKTFVVGSRDTAHLIGGFYIAATGKGSKIEGLTVTDCAVSSGEYGGGFSTTTGDATTNAYMVAYCTVTNCAATRGGGMYSGFAFSCRFVGNSATMGGCIYRASAYNCVLSDSSATNGGGAYDYGWLVNCTAMNNAGDRGVQVSLDWRNKGYGRVWNTVSASNKSANNDANGIYTNSVIDATDATYYNPISEDVTLVVHGGSGSATSFTSNVVINVIKGDFAPVKGGYLDAKGVRDYLDLDIIPPEYRGRGFDGQPWTGDVPIGALIAAKEAKSAPIVFVNPVRIYGKESLMNYTAIYSDVWPQQVYVEPRATQVETCVAFTYGNLVTSIRRYLGLKKGVWALFPPKTEADGMTPVKHLTITPVVAAKTLWVDDDAKFEGGADGTEGKPYSTIQAACDAVGTVASVETRINVMPGVYSNGVSTSTYSSARARVVLPASRSITIIGVEGPEKTFVTGEPGSNGGIDTDSVRCFASPNNTTLGIVGLTLMNGYTSKDDVSGGAVRGGGIKQQVWDCVFTCNHSAQSGACVNQAPTFRCLFTNNVDNTIGCHINIGATSCIFANNATESHTYMPFNNSCESYGCTIYEPMASADCYLWGSNIKAFNTVVVTGGKTTSVSQNHGILSGNVIGDVKNYQGAFIDEQQLHANPFVAHPAALDFRLTEISPALTAGRCVNAPATTTASDKAFTAADFVLYMIGDYYGNPQVLEDGSVRAGAVTTVKPATNVYADAANGNDGNDGMSEGTAKKTLQVAIEAAAPGDTVVALPGVYRTGELVHAGTAVVGDAAQVLKNRVVVPEGYVLKSRDGAEMTVIEGAPDPDTKACGPKAVRCAFVEKAAKICGFTLRGGYTCDNSIGNMEDTYGGAVLGRGQASGGRIEDCIIADNSGCRGAGGAYVILDRCIVTNNTATVEGSGGIFCSAFNSYFAECHGQRVMDYSTELVNCTFGQGCAGLNGKATHLISTVYDKIVNVLVAGLTSNDACDFSQTQIRNFIVPKSVNFTYGENVSGLVTNLTLEAIAADYDGNGCPKSNASVGVDIGFASDEAGDIDLAGNARVQNGTIDIGCYEYDWRGDYAKSLGRQVTVTDASSTLVMAGGKVVFHDGDWMSVDWASGGKTETGYEICVVLDGMGTFTAYGADGSVIGTLTQSGTIAFQSPLEATNLRFAYASSNGGMAYIDRMHRLNGMLLIVR